MHVRDSLKEIDNLLKNLKNKSVEELKALEQKAATLQLELDSVSISNEEKVAEIILKLMKLFLIQVNLEYNNLKRIFSKSEPERDSDKQRLIEATDRQFEVTKIC